MSSVLCLALSLWPAGASAQPGLVEVPTFPPPAETVGPVVVPERPEPEALIQHLTLEATPPPRGRSAPRPNRVVDVGIARIVGQTFFGEVVGALLGGSIGAFVSVATCREGEAQWLSGFRCEAGIGFAIAIGGIAGATLGGPLAIARLDGAWGARGDPWAALGGASIGATVGAVLSAILVSTWSQPSWSAFVGGGVGLLTSTVLEVLFYDLSRPHDLRVVAAGRGPRAPRPSITADPNAFVVSLAGEL